LRGTRNLKAIAIPDVSHNSLQGSLGTYLKSCAFGIGAVACLAHTYCDGSDVVEQDIVCAFVVLPLGDELAQAIVEDLLVDDDFVRHDGRDGWIPPVSVRIEEKRVVGDRKKSVGGALDKSRRDTLGCGVAWRAESTCTRSH
jgi:hypothetical protein